MLMVQWTKALVLLSVLFLATASAQAQGRRVALVIGNSAYQHTPPLTNPKNDAEDVASALGNLGFEVTQGFDLDKAGMDRTIRTFASKLAGADIGLFFYAGHGLQVGGVNYLVPVDAQLTSAAALDFEMTRLDLVQRTMENETKTNVIMLDACRDNPLSRNLARAMGTRSTMIGRGLAQTEAGVGTLVSYSTQPGNVALDGTGRNSPYAGSLVRHIRSAGEDLTSILIRVRNDVIDATANRQVPWDQHALRERLSLSGRPQQAQSSAGDAAQAWAVTQNSTSIAVLEAFERQFPNTAFSTMARARIDELKQRTAVAKANSERLLSEIEKKTAALVPGADRPNSTSCAGIVVPLASGGTVCVKPGSGQSFRDCPHCPELVAIPKGSFTMGAPPTEKGRNDDEDRLKVTIPAPFAIGRYSVTRGEFASFVEETGHETDGGCRFWSGTAFVQQADRSWRSVGFDQDDRHPVVCINWHDAKAYAAWLSKKTGLTYRLPSESEREYATRASSETPFWWGASISTRQANYDGNFTYASGPVGEYRQATVAVDSFDANRWGLYNVHGNVWEWTEDCYANKNAGNPGNGDARAGNAQCPRVLRGGSRLSGPVHLRAARRNSLNASIRSHAVGFRVVRTLSTTP